MLAEQSLCHHAYAMLWICACQHGFIDQPNQSKPDQTKTASDQSGERAFILCSALLWSGLVWSGLCVHLFWMFLDGFGRMSVCSDAWVDTNAK